MDNPSAAAKRESYRWHRIIAGHYATLQSSNGFRNKILSFVDSELDCGPGRLLYPARGRSLGAAIMASYAVLCGDLAKQAVGKASQTSPRQERMIPTFTRLRDHVYWKEDGQLVGEVTPENIWCALENKWARNTMLGISVSTLLMRGAVRSLGTNVYDRKQMYAVLRQSIGLAETFAALHDEVENATLATIIERRHNTDRVLSGYAGDVMEDFIIIPSDYYAINNWPFGAIAFQNLPHFDAPPDTPTMGCPLRQLDKTRPPSGDRIMDTILASSWNLTAEVYTTIWERGAA